MSRTQKSIIGAVSHFSAESEVLIVIVFLWLACLLQAICLVLQHRRSPRIPFKPLGSILISAAQRRKEKYRKDKSVPPKKFKKTDIDGGQGNWDSMTHPTQGWSAAEVKTDLWFAKGDFTVPVRASRPHRPSPGQCYLSPPAAGGLRPNPNTPVPILQRVSTNCHFICVRVWVVPILFCYILPPVPAEVPWCQGTAAAAVLSMCCG